MFAGDPAPFVMELPAYHIPSASNVLRGTWERGWSFIKRAGTIILLSSIVLWFLQGYGFVDGVFQAVEDVAKLKVAHPTQLSFVTQTTLSIDDASRVIDALKAQFPDVQGPKKDDICYATQNRQDAVKDLVDQCDLVLVVGSPNSSNSRRLKEVAVARGISAYLLDGPDEIMPAWLEGKTKIGISAGASAPEILVRQVVDRIVGLTGAEVKQLVGVEENVSFPLPKELVLN